MVLVTLIGDAHAHIGNRFYYLGPNDECRDCRLKNVCFNLDAGSLYEIVQLRDARHDCALREDQVRVVVVEKVPFQAAVPKKLAIDGSMITFESKACGRLDCKRWGGHCMFVYLTLDRGDKIITPVFQQNPTGVPYMGFMDIPIGAIVDLEISAVGDGERGRLIYAEWLPDETDPKEAFEKLLGEPGITEDACPEV